MQIVGQENNLELINKYETLPQFIILSGDEHTGKTYFTKYLCNKFKLHYVKVENGINDVRKLLEVMKEDSNTLYHFKDFHRATTRAKNALLKITEEPKRGNYILISGSSQLRTLESRARKIIMQPYNKDEILEYMKVYFQDKSLQNNLYRVGINTPAKVELYKDCEYIGDLVSYACTIFEKITYISMDDIILMLSKFESRYENKDIDICLLFLNMLINLIEYHIKTKQLYEYYDILNILIDGKTQIIRESSLNRKLLIYRIFYAIYYINRKGFNNEEIRNIKN